MQQQPLSLFVQLFFALAIAALLFIGAAFLTFVFGRSEPNGLMAIAASMCFSSALIGSILLSNK